ncbi:MAG: diguanylate cyclase [Candidatus Izemoplasmatales bacterium]|nr:diguanylate cyclase [Candidatus Izemoplasmatales bacterium]MDY0372534.1 diguanylate cyclase [Candidatus Izemoplasmatales bacterium]
MRFDLLLASILIAIASVFLLGVFFIFTRKGVLLGFRLLGLLAFATSVFVIGYAVDLFSNQESVQLVTIHLTYFGVPWLMVLWFFLSVQQKTRTRTLSFRQYGIFLIIPTVTFMTAMLYPWKSGIDPGWIQTLYFSSHQVVTMPEVAPGFTTILFEKGPIYYVFMAYNMVLAGWSGMNYLAFAKKANARNQKRIIFLAVLSFCAALVIIYTFIYPRTASIDPSPYSASFFVITCFIGLYKYEFFDVIPMAYRQIFHNANHPIVVLDCDNTVISANSSARKIFGNSLDFQTILTLSDICQMKPGGLEEVTQNNFMEMDVSVQGETRFFRMELQPLVSRAKQLKGKVLVFRDVTDVKAEMQKMEKIATYDDLTKILNRRVFYLRASQAFDEAILEKTKFSFIMFDLDDFKNVNDIYGHLVGDSVLFEMASLFSNQLDGDAIFARYGGEEFIVFLIKKGPNEALEMAESLRSSLENHLFTFDNRKIGLTASFGVSGSEGQTNKSFERYLKESDDALYQAKHAGKNRVSIIQ